MRNEIVQVDIEKVRRETATGGNTCQRIASILTQLNDSKLENNEVTEKLNEKAGLADLELKANVGADNLSKQHITGWTNKLFVDDKGNMRIGEEALMSIASGTNNVMFGKGAGKSLEEGSDNTFIGANAGYLIRKASNMTLIGSHSGQTLVHDIKYSDLEATAPIYKKYVDDGWMNDYLGYNADTQRLHSSLSTIIGTYTSSKEAELVRTLGMISIGFQPNYGIKYRFFNGITIGNMIYSNTRSINNYNGIYIGNHLIPMSSYGELAIDNGIDDRIPASKALIYGKLDNAKYNTKKELRINGAFSIDPARNEVLTEHTVENFVVMDARGYMKQIRLDLLKTIVGGGSGTPTPSVNNKLAGKKISFIGDSITSWGESTNNEYTPAKGYAYEDVWTAQLLSLTGGVKATLDGRTGSRVTGIDGDAFAFSRTKVVAQDSDFIFIFMGANDQRALNVPTTGVPLGEIKDKTSLGDITNVNNPNLKKFTEAYQLALENMLPYYKKSQIILMTPLRSFHEGSTDDQNKDSDKLAERIIDIAKMYGIKWIDMREVGITKYNHGIYFYDGLHPNKRGHRLIAEYVTSKMLEFGTVGKLEASDYYTKTQIDEKLKALPKGNTPASSSDIVIGGANLLRNTALPMFSPNDTGTGTPKVMDDATGYFVRYTPHADKVVSLYGLFLERSNLGNHSRSMDFRHSHTGNITIWGQSIPPNKWTRVKQEKFTNANGWCSFFSDIAGVAIDVRNYKIELGTKSTDWIPHISEYNLGASPNMIDQVFAWTDDLNIVADEYEGNDRIFYNIPYIDFIVNILDFYWIYKDGTTKKMEGMKTVTDRLNRKGIPFKSDDLGNKDVAKVYIKALLK